MAGQPGLRHRSSAASQLAFIVPGWARPCVFTVGDPSRPLHPPTRPPPPPPASPPPAPPVKDIIDHLIRNPPAVRTSAGAAGAPNPGVYPPARPGAQPAYYTQRQQYTGPGHMQAHPHHRRGPGQDPASSQPPLPPPPSYGSHAGPRPAFYTAAGNRSAQSQQLQHQAQPGGPAVNGHPEGRADSRPSPRARLEEQHSMGERHTQMPPLPSTFPRLEEAQCVRGCRSPPGVGGEGPSCHPALTRSPPRLQGGGASPHRV